MSKKEEDNSLQKLFTKFWVQEEVPSDTSFQLTPKEHQYEDHFMKTRVIL